MFTPGVDYVYVPNSRVGGSQRKVRYILNDFNIFLNLVNNTAPMCVSALSKALCIHYYLPCGLNGSLHVPQFLCPDTCRYLTDVVCRTIWKTAVRQLTTGLHPSLQNMNLDLPVCNDTSMAVAFLNLSDDCCRTGGVIIPQAPENCCSTSGVIIPQTPAATEPLVIIGSAVGGGVALLLTMAIISSLLITFLCWRRRKIKRENLDMIIRYMHIVVIVYTCIKKQLLSTCSVLIKELCVSSKKKIAICNLSNNYTIIYYSNWPGAHSHRCYSSRNKYTDIE